MASPMRLSLSITADASGVAPATAEARKAVDGLGTSARSTAEALDLQASAEREAAAAASTAAVATDGLGDSARSTAAALDLEAKAGLEAAASARTAIEAINGQAAAQRNLQAAVANFAGVRPAGQNDNSARQADLDAYGQALDQVRAKHVPLFAAQQAYAANLDEISQAAKVGAISEDERAAAVQRATAAYNAQVAATGNVVRLNGAAAAGTKLAAHEVTNLTRQISDVGVSLASGQSPFMVMIQQGAQVQDIMGKRGLGQVLTGLVEGLGAMLTPTTAILLGVTALGYAASAVYGAMKSDVKTLDVALGDYEKKVRLVGDAWGYAAQKAKEMPIVDGRGGDLIAAASVEQLRLSLQREAQQIVTDKIVPLGSFFGPNEFISSQFKPFEEALRSLQKTTADGNPDIAEFRRLVTERWSLDPLNKELTDTASNLLAITDASMQAVNAIGRLEQMRVARVDAYRQYAASRIAGPEAKAAQDELEQRKRQDQAGPYGHGIPIPTRRPNLEDEPSRAQEMLRTQDERIERIRLEAQMIGQSEAVRARMIALLAAEQDIRRAGIDAQGEEAQRYRDGAVALADYTTEVQRHADAWNSFEKAGESAIDKVLDKLSNGDFEGALDALAQDFKKFLLEMAGNQLKNTLLGTNYGTLGDLGKGEGGGLIGKIIARLTGRPAAAANDNPAPAAPTSNVVRLPLAGIAANDNLASGDIAGYIRQAAKLRGIDPDIALRVARSEGGLKDPFRQGEAMLSYGREESYGPFQLHMRQGGVGTRALKAGIDPRQNWQGGVDYALDEAANKGWGQWFGAAKAGIGNREGLDGAKAIGQLSDAAKKAAGGLGDLDTGITSAVKAIAGGSGGGTGGFDLKSLFSPNFKESGGGFASLIGYGSAAKTKPKAGAAAGGFLELLFSFLPKLFGFRYGTEDAPPGWAWVGEDGPELMKFGGGEKVINSRRSAEMTRDIPVKWPTFAGAGPSVFSGGSGGRDAGAYVVKPQTIIQPPAGYEAKTETDRDDEGNERVNVTFSRLMASEAGRKGSPFSRQLRAMGVSTPGKARS